MTRKRSSPSPAAPTTKQSKTESEWLQLPDVIVRIPAVVNPSNAETAPMIGFDLDYTLIATKSGKTFPKNRADWKIWHDSVPAKLASIVQDGAIPVIFTNQSSVGAGKISVDAITGKIDDLLHALDLADTMWAVISTAKAGVYRKPSVGMFGLFMEKLAGESSVTIDMPTSMYVGDAAGRPACAKEKRKKDFHDSDLKFALNLGIKFQTPEEFFLDSLAELHTDIPAIGDERLGFDPRSYESSQVALEDAVMTPAEGLELIVCVGSPASGKSSFAKTYFPKYFAANRDTYKTPAKCLKLARESLKDGVSVIVDNTNPTPQARSPYIDLANEFDIPVRCLFFERTKEEVFHVNAFRTITPHRENRRIPGVAIHMFFKKLEPPSVEEGFASVAKVPFVLRQDAFVNSSEKQIFLSFLL